MKSIILISISIFCIAELLAQNRSIKGSVKDAITSELLIGVSIVIPNNSNRAMTDTEGHYTIQVPEHNTVLGFSYLGYEDLSITIMPNQSEVNVLMNPMVYSLSDVVVTGYTTQSKRQTTGAVSKINAENISIEPVASLDQSLQGRVPGLYVASPSGLPGAPGRVTIRGIGSLQGNTNPLYIVDGIPIEPASFAALNANDFETFTVLKDAASTSQYGSRAANGVIIITTKKGQPFENGKLHIQYQNQFGFSRVNNSKWNMMNTNQRLQFEEILQDPTLPGWQYSRKNKFNPNGSLKSEADYAYGDHYLDNLRKRNIDLRKKILRTGVTQSHDIAISGGNDKTTYYHSGSYFSQEGVVRNSGLERYNLRSNIQHNNGRLKLGINIGLGYTNAKVLEGDFDVSETNPIASLYMALPYEKLYNNNGTLATGTNKYGSNALSMVQNINKKETQLKNITAVTATYKLTDEFKLTGTTGMDLQQFRNTSLIKPDSYFGSLVDPGGQGSYESQYINKIGFITTGGISYNKIWNHHEIEANVLTEMNQKQINSAGFTGYGLISGINTPAGITQGTPENSFISNINGGQSRNVLLSQIGLFRYSYLDKYTLTTSLRRDGSSQVPRDNRYKMFYAIGGNWNIDKEDFIKDTDLLGTLKLRASYGRTGNASGFASDFGYRGLLGATSYNGMSALAPVYPSNPNYNWELNDIGNVGLDFGLFRDRIRGSLDLYNRITSDLFLEKRLSHTSGFESIATNAGKIRNRGIEFAFEGDVTRVKDFTLTLGFNIGYNQNQILHLGDEDELITNDYSINRVGLPLGQFYMVRWAGVDPQTGAPKYLDTNGNETYTYNPDDAVPVKGSFDPPYKGGATLNVQYKNLELLTLFTFIKGMYRLNTAEFFRTSADANHRVYNQSVDMLNIWQKPGDVTDHPAAHFPRYITDRELQSADYIKLRNIVLSYKIPIGSYLKNHIQGMKVFAQGQNLFTWTSFKAFDPEDDNNWYQYEYPLPRTITFGFNILF